MRFLILITNIKIMEWFIKKNSTLPKLRVKVIKDGRSDFRKQYSELSGSTVFFSMIDTETLVPKISTKDALVTSETDNNGIIQYYLEFQFTKQNTKKEGRYFGEFMIKNSDGVIFLPLTEKLYINVIDSFGLDESSFVDNYNIDYSCCGDNVRPTKLAKFLSTQNSFKLVTNQGFSATTKYIITLNT